MSYRREQKLQGRQFDTTQTPFSHHFSCISLKALKNTNTKKISHSDCICPAGASTWDDAVYLNLSTLQVRSIGWHTWGGDLRGPTLSSSGQELHFHSTHILSGFQYSSSTALCVSTLLNCLMSRANTTLYASCVWNETRFVVEKLRCCYGFTCTTKRFMMDSTAQRAGKKDAWLQEGNLWFLRPEAYSPQPVLTVQEYSGKSAYQTFYHEE